MRRGVWAVVMGATLAGCMADEGVRSEASSIAIPGPWVPSPLTRLAAASQHVTVVDAPPIHPSGSCGVPDPFACSCMHPACHSAFPGTSELNAFLLRRYTFLRAGGTYCCRQNSAMTPVPMLSVHSLGRAIDVMVPLIGGDADNTLGDAVANWLVENAEFIGIQRVIWDRAYWNGETGFGLLSPASLSHTNHVHLELSLAGAERRTAFFTSGASMSTTCAARCDGTRLVRADCTSVDCAATGAPCVGGATPACGTPAPPEPAEAARVATAVIPGVRTIAAPGRFTFVGPQRLFDTRTPADSARLVRSGAPGPLNPSSNGTFRDWSSLGLPSGTTGVWLNVAALGVRGPGFVTAFAAGEPRPPTSSVNFVADVPNANATPAVLGASAGVTFEANTDAHLITDAYGAFSPTGSGLAPAGPVRVLDTRSDVALVANVAREIDVRAPAGATGVVATVAVLAGAAPGFLSAYPCGSTPPATSNLNYAAGAVVANTVVSALGGGRLCVRSNADANVVVDVTGYFTPTGGLVYTALSPQRILDTREATSLYTGRLGARQVIELPIQRMPSMPASAVAVVANVTAVGAAGPGFVTAFPCGTPVPGTSSLNFPADRAVGALTVATLGSGSLCVFTNARTHLIVDVLGVWTGAATPAAPPPVDVGDDIPPEAFDGGAMGVDASAAGDASATSDASAAVDAHAAVDGASGGDAWAGDARAAGDGAATDDAAVGDAVGAAGDAATLDDAGPDATDYVPDDRGLSGGCGCRATGETRRGGAASGLGVWALALAARRRRARRR